MSGTTNSREPATTTTGVAAPKPPLGDRARAAISSRIGDGLERDRKGLGSIAPRRHRDHRRLPHRPLRVGAIRSPSSPPSRPS
jgi:hypothetical protein